MNENGPLDVELDQVDTSFPLINPGTLCDFRIIKVELKANAASTLMMEFQTVDSVKSNKGEELAPGVKVFENLNLVPTGNSKPQYVQQNVAAFYQATGLKGWKLSDIPPRHKEFEGQIVRCRVEVMAAGLDKNNIHRKAKNIITEYVKKQ